MTIWRAFLEIAPAAKARPRVTRRGTHMPEKYMQWRQKFCWLCKLVPPPTGRMKDCIGMTIRIQTLNGRMRPDLDNAFAACADALQDAGIIDNDRNIVKLEATICQSKQAGIYLEVSDGWREVVL